MSEHTGTEPRAAKLRGLAELLRTVADELTEMAGKSDQAAVQSCGTCRYKAYTRTMHPCSECLGVDGMPQWMSLNTDVYEPDDIGDYEPPEESDAQLRLVADEENGS